jgi:hypothetical protein
MYAGVKLAVDSIRRAGEILLGFLTSMGSPVFPIPIEIRADIRAFQTASLAGESRLDIGQPNVLRPAVAADRDRMAALVVLAIDQQAANAIGAHLCKGDLLLAGLFGHPTLYRKLDAFLKMKGAYDVSAK